MEEFNKSKYIFSNTPAILDVTQKISQNREKQISLMIKELFLYKVLLKDLVGHTPSYIDKNLILNIAYFIVENGDILESVQKRRELPMSVLSKKTQVSRTFLEIWQDYILTYCIILSNPNYKHIQDYIKIEYRDENKNVSSMISSKTEIHRGIVLKAFRTSSIILTSSGDFIKVKDRSTEVAQETEAKEKKGIRHYKIQLSIISVLILLSAFGVYNEYTKPVSTILVQTTSQVKYEINRFNKVIYVYAASEKGNDIINYSDPIDKDIDIVIQKTIEYAVDNNMKPENGIVITVTGKSLKYGDLEQTGEYIVEKDVKVLINNNGNQHKLYESTVGQKEDKNEEDK